MKIIIAGAGRVGGAVASVLSADAHDITLIERDPDIISVVSGQQDVICIEGSATSSSVLREAGADRADLLIAVTEKDETNMLCGISAKKMGTKHVLARVRDPEYHSNRDFLRDALGIDSLVNPEYECAAEISRILRFHGATRVDTFSKGTLEIAECRVFEGDKIDGVPVKDIRRLFGAKVLISLVEREDGAFIPNGDFMIKSGDTLSVTGTNAELKKFFTALHPEQKNVRKALIMGGGRISVYLAKILHECDIDVTVIEKDYERCRELCDIIPDAHVLYGDATYSSVFGEEGIDERDAFIALTGDDGDNIITSVYAKSLGAGTVITKVMHDHFAEVTASSDIDSVVTIREIVARHIASYVRALENSKDSSSIETMIPLAGGLAEAVEIKIGEIDRHTGIMLKNLQFKPGIIIAALIRGSECIIPDGGSSILLGDHAVIVSASGTVKCFSDIFAD